MSQVRAGAELLARLDPPPEPALELEDGLVGFQLPTPVALGRQRDLREGVGPVRVVHGWDRLEPPLEAVPTPDGDGVAFDGLQDGVGEEAGLPSGRAGQLPPRRSR
jgi:hypothetical protein